MAGTRCAPGCEVPGCEVPGCEVPGCEVIADTVPLLSVPAALLQDVPFQLGAGWWRCAIEAGLPPGASPHLLLASAGGRPLGLLPLYRTPALYKTWALRGLVTPYTTLFQPVLAPGADAVALGRAFGRACAAWPVLTLDALDGDWPGWPPLLAGFAAAGWRAAWFDSFGNWHAAATAGWAAYLAARPGALRETIRRRLGRAERDATVTFTLARQPQQVDSEWTAYEAVYRRSWKPPEPFVAFGPAFAAAAAAAGVLRLGVLRRNGEPLAAQYWTVEGHVATVHKLAHDEAAKTLSPGTVLTAWMIRALLADGVTALDFGRGDDPYKQLWADARRQRRGLVIAKPWRPRGAAALLRQTFSQKLRRANR